MHTGQLKVGHENLVIETGKVAKQADGSVIMRYGETVVLVTACYAPTAREGIDFLPLTVDYREYTYASGRIPGGFFKREGRPTEKEVLTSRLIDRPIRPLFPSGVESRNASHRAGPLRRRRQRSRRAGVDWCLGSARIVEDSFSENHRLCPCRHDRRGIPDQPDLLGAKSQPARPDCGRKQ